MARTLTERFWVARLNDAYGRLLTPHQQRLLRLYYLDDLSLSEIAQRLQVTRQAVFDGLRRSVGELERIETILRLLHVRDRADKREHAVQARLDALEDAIANLDGRVEATVLASIATALTALRRAVE
jgi:predicted DNA-binding protein YlxM (UPF0122 family)